MATVKFVEKLFGDQNKKKLKALEKDVAAINELEPQIQKLTDDELAGKTEHFRKRLAEGESLDAIRNEAFAVVREAARRTLGQRHYDVQIMGGLTLHQGKIAEMRTGEGKTLSATCAVYLNALAGDGVHIITVNDYLARRDADWMGQIYHFLGLTIGCIQGQNTSFKYDADIEAVKRPAEGAEAATGEDPSTEGAGYEALITADMEHLRPVPRAEAYACDITFGTNNEFGFDYLRDNMVQKPEDRVQRGLNYAIIDEVDSILIDEARTPLIISAPAAEATSQYTRFFNLVAALTEEEDFTVDEKMRSAALTDAGIAKLEKALGVENIYTAGGLRTVHHIEQALKARTLFTRDKDYVVRDGEVVIVDEFTGRMMQGRRYSEGLHQAIEAKEGIEVKQESRTLATITLQNLFRLYNKLSGMTGTAETEAEEFYKIYGLDVVVIPTHREIRRIDASDRVYKNRSGKYRAVIKEIKLLHEQGRPTLVGTISIEQNEFLSRLLTEANVPHKVLNAKHHEQEAEIIAQAGKLGAVTVATNMAGRGVDIILGGNPIDIDEARKIKELGGLAVIGTERHDSRRIDNQLRGRSGRQGDPGSSQFFVSMDDELMRIFGSDRMKNFMSKMGVPDDMPIENRMVSRSIESAQSKVESRNFDIRKHLVEYDDVINKHRDTIYRRRNEVLESSPEKMHEMILEVIEAEVEHIVSFHTNGENDYGEREWDVKEISSAMQAIFPISDEECSAAIEELKNGGDSKLEEAEARTQIIDFFTTRAHDSYEELTRGVADVSKVDDVERALYLRAIDMLWVAHLDQMSFLRDSIGLRGYGQRDPLVEYKRESYQMFQVLLANIQKEVVMNVFRVGEAQALVGATVKQQNVQYVAPEKEMQRKENPLAGQSSAEKERQAQPYRSEKKDEQGHKVGRNDPCPCGSGKKYKKCHGVTE